MTTRTLGQRIAAVRRDLKIYYGCSLEYFLANARRFRESDDIETRRSAERLFEEIASIPIMVDQATGKLRVSRRRD